MKAKLVLVLALLAVVALIPIPQRVEASCSGVTCGCDVDQQECIADCPPEGQTGWLGCRTQCLKQYRQCSCLCCSDGYTDCTHA